MSSAEVAEDYKNSLEDLVATARWEINNLTVIARENTEHAIAISKVLENHIRTTTAERKLPALYVLDSIVKNVGTPYNIILGHNLFRTFMEAYALVHENVRKKLEEMLVTWKQPMPGSNDPRPIFPAETIKPIETALIRWRTQALQKQQEEQKPLFKAVQSGATPFRNNPTPPQNFNRYQQPPTQGFTGRPIINGHSQPQPSRPSYPQHPPQTGGPPAIHQQYQSPPPVHYSNQSAYQPPAQQSQALDALFKDIDNLIYYFKTSFANNVGDGDARTKLQALLQLQTLLRTQHVPNVDEIRAQLASLTYAPLPAAAQGPYASPPPQPSGPYDNPLSPSNYMPPSASTHYSPPPASSALPPPVSMGQPDLSNILGSNNLASLLASVTAQQPMQQSASLPAAMANPSVPAPTPPYGQPSNPPMPPSSSAAQPSSLIASLRAAGVLPQESGSPINGPMAQPPASSYSHQPAPTGTANTETSAPAQPFSASPKNDVELTTPSLKIPRPHLITSLYERFPSKCSTCGKRFASTAEGKEKKARHYDWHFRIRMKREDAAKRGQSRSWYVSELEWIRWRETGEEGEQVATDGARSSEAKAAAAAEAAQKDPKNQWIRVPDDHALANAPCPICQEPFEKSYDENIGDWVWRDAIRIGTRVYHASEYSELKSEGASTPMRTSTPDSVLGKRKGGGVDTSSNVSRLKVA